MSGGDGGSDKKRTYSEFEKELLAETKRLKEAYDAMKEENTTLRAQLNDTYIQSQVYQGQLEMERKRTDQLMDKTFSGMAKAYQKQPNPNPSSLPTLWEEDHHGMDEATKNSLKDQSDKDAEYAKKLDLESNEWECQTCTLLNEASATICEACGNPHDEGSASASGGGF
jgi:hypothetical protein